MFHYFTLKHSVNPKSFGIKYFKDPNFSENRQFETQNKHKKDNFVKTDKEDEDDNQEEIDFISDTKFLQFYNDQWSCVATELVI